MPRLPPSITTALPQHDSAPSLPPDPASPTLTNPDYILPGSGLPSVNSPPRLTRRPPSPGYLREEGSSPKTPMAKKDNALGLVSKKMMLLRGRNSSGGGKPPTRHSPGQSSPDLIPSSPILQDVGNLAPEQPEYLQLPENDRRSNSGGSSSSDISGLTGFLSRYPKQEGVASDDETVDEGGESSPPQTRFPSSATEAEEELDIERQKQQREEYNSAILSRRAEQILANAKKRLNVMEGNLRGARDLVAPLTAANLKRATSLGSAQYTAVYARRQMGEEYDTPGQQPPRKLAPQASSPTIGRDYQGHARGFSENDMPERPYTSLEHSHQKLPRHTRIPVRPSDSHGLRGSRSYDSLGASSGVGYGVGRDRSLHARDSPDSSQLETLQEADERRFRDSGNAWDDFSNNGLGIYRPSSRTSDLREQMSSLKGKISSLKERAREDSLRRRSQLNLKHASPFNNALATAPELFYTSSASYGSPVLDTNAGVGWTSNSDSPASPQKMWENGMPITGSRNAFAEQAAAEKDSTFQHARERDGLARKTPDGKFHTPSPSNPRAELESPHRRTPSGTAIIESAKNRYSHHQRGESISDDYLQNDDYLEVPSPALPNDNYDPFDQYDSASTASGPSPATDDGYVPSDDGTSVYEDASSDVEEMIEEKEPVVAHEDRADAFDYEQFFLHSSMAAYGKGRRGSVSSEDSISSVETAKGPVARNGRGDDDDFTDDLIDDDLDFDDSFPPATPETPERLREIERNLHKRTFSDESTTTVNTFATAEEDSNSPVDDVNTTHGYGERQVVSPMSRSASRAASHRRSVVSPVETMSRSASRTESQQSSGSSNRPSSRPNTAVRHHARTDSSSDRADSGVGLPRRSMGSNDTARLAAATTISSQHKSTRSQPTNGSAGISTSPAPPMSPELFSSRQDPATTAVNALLDPNGKPLGLRNKAILFGVVESLRLVVHQLQREDEAHYEARVLRRKLDEAKIALDGRNPG